MRRLCFPIALLALLLPLACGGGTGSGGGPTTTASVAQLTVGDAPADEFSAFVVTLTKVELLRGGGAVIPLLPAPRAVDLIDLRTQSALVGVSQLATGTYDSLRLEVDPNSVSARDLRGVLVPVQTQVATVTLPLTAPLTVAAGTIIGLHLDIDLNASMQQSSSGGWTFLPSPRVGRRNSSSSESIDEIHGRVLSTNPPTRRLVANLVDRSSGASLGPLTIEIDDNTALIDDDDRPFANEATFFAAAAAGVRIESHGVLRSDGIFLAGVVEIEDDDRSSSVAELKGTITSIDQGAATLRMRIHEIEHGHGTVAPVLIAIGNPPEIDISFAAAVLRVRGSSSRSTPFALQIGQRIEVEFSAFSQPPFPAREIELHSGGAEFEGTVIDISGLPSSFVVRLEPHDPSVQSGAVASSSTPVRVDLDGSERIHLKLGHDPVVGTAGILLGLRVRVRGSLSGSSTAATIDAGEVRIRPGRLRGTVAGADQNTRTLSIANSRIDDPFGAPLASPLIAQMAQGIQVTGDASSLSGLWSLWNARGNNQLDVRAFGIANSVGGVDIHEIDVDVR